MKKMKKKNRFTQIKKTLLIAVVDIIFSFQAFSKKKVEYKKKISATLWIVIFFKFPFSFLLSQKKLN